jgi:hypothetical protein
MIDLLLIALLQTTEPLPPADATSPPTEQVVVTAPAETAPAAEEEDPDDQRLICRTDRTTGSRVRRERTCITVAQQRREREATERSQAVNGSTQGRCLDSGAC